MGVVRIIALVVIGVHRLHYSLHTLLEREIDKMLGRREVCDKVNVHQNISNNLILSSCTPLLFFASFVVVDIRSTKERLVLAVHSSPSILPRVD